MKQTVVVKNVRIVQMPIINCLNAVPSETNLSFREFIPIDEQMRAQGEQTHLSAEIALDEILRDHDAAWKALAKV